METTIVRDSQVGDQWIKEMVAANPIQKCINPQTGQWNGNFTTGPVRLMFSDALLEAKPQMRSKPQESPLKFSCAAMFTPLADLRPLYEEFYRIAATEFGDTAYVDQNGQTQYNVDNPFRDQREKAQHGGWTPGAIFLNLSSNFQPAVVDPHYNPIVDKNKIYDGVWAILSINGYPSGKGTPRKGPRFGLVQAMIVGEDKKIGGGGAPDPRQTFAGVNVKPPVVAPGAQFGQALPGRPAGGPVNAAQFYPPAGGVPQGGYAPPGVPAGAPGPQYGAPQLTAEELELRRMTQGY
jgi:hypothetical protein